MDPLAAFMVGERTFYVFLSVSPQMVSNQIIRSTQRFRRANTNIITASFLSVYM